MSSTFSVEADIAKKQSKLMKATLVVLATLLITCCTPPNNKDNTIEQKDITLLTQLEDALDKEQEIRKQVIESMQEGKLDRDLEKKMSAIDSVNLILAKEYLNKNGWPKRSKVGEKVSNAIFYIIQHSNQETMKSYLPQLEQVVNKGEAKKKHFAMMQDRVLVGDNLPQMYGTQSVPRKDENGYITSNYYIWPIKDNSIVDSLRNEMGFKKSITEYAKSIDAEYNLDEKKIGFGTTN